jgi:hypothetical protein
MEWVVEPFLAAFAGGRGSSLALRFAEEERSLCELRAGKEKLFDLPGSREGEGARSARESNRLKVVISGGIGVLPGERNLGRDLIASDADVSKTIFTSTAEAGRRFQQRNGQAS